MGSLKTSYNQGWRLMAEIAVVGGNGFVGSSICSELKKKKLILLK